jgi:hypothetical protein
MVSFASFSGAAIVTLFSVSRGIFMIDEFRRLSTERATDQYMKNVCEQVDYKQIGRHADMCAGVNHRLSNPIVFHVVKSVVDDTIHQEVTMQGVLTTLGVLTLLFMISTLQKRYLKLVLSDTGLPTVYKHTKNE